jgi:hypothetical protein
MSFPQEYQGWTSYRSDLYLGPHRLFVAVSCIISDLTTATDGMLDTAAEWCVLSSDLTAALGFGSDEDYPHRLDTRLGAFQGRLERLPLLFLAAEGSSLMVEATWFVSPDWPGPVVLGWKGCLERFRFALDPREERFYFGAW